MFRNIVSVCLSIIFLVFLSAPTVITIVDDSIDVSFFFASSEEEEKGGKKDKDVEILVFDLNMSELDFVSNESENDLEYYFKNYPKPHLNLISPPPQLHIL
ncbi:hypothetical protein Q4Q39_06340 [Flavivirga amylovorans]|uniref:Uncharacterized protein n=1 Tax=Flavivirga amylovorans TaxID=870486 RepID=A0ABT8X067_9FLAO|nr:hypothetical protein [Flavivirga amylovorans]MDO5987024.1 hypothetical protein [Flavivirga amylovorans]